VGHTTTDWYNAQNSWLSRAKQAVTEVSVDGGKVRLRSETGAGSQWLFVQSTSLGIYYNSAFHDNQSLIDWVNS